MVQVLRGQRAGAGPFRSAALADGGHAPAAALAADAPAPPAAGEAASAAAAAGVAPTVATAATPAGDETGGGGGGGCAAGEADGSAPLEAIGEETAATEATAAAAAPGPGSTILLCDADTACAPTASQNVARPMTLTFDVRDRRTSACEARRVKGGRGRGRLAPSRLVGCRGRKLMAHSSLGSGNNPRWSSSLERPEQPWSSLGSLSSWSSCR